MKKYLLPVLGLVLAQALWWGMAPSNTAYGFTGNISAVPTNNEHGVRRNVYNHTIREGDVIKDAVDVSNRSGETLTVFVFSGGQEVVGGQLVDADLPDEDRIDEPGTWLQFAQQEFVISPGAVRSIPFSIHVPENVDVGDHQTILYAQAITRDADTHGSGLNITVRNGITIYMTVPGEIDRTLVIERITHHISPFWKLFNKDLSFTVGFRNEGNVTLRPVADIELRGIFGAAGSMDDVEYTKIRRESSGEGVKAWYRRAPYFGRFVAEFDFHLGEKEQINEDGSKTILPDEAVHATYVFWVFPWIEIIYFVLLLFILYLVRSAWIYLVIAKRMRAKTKEYTVKKSDTLSSIAIDHGISVKLLIRFNMMRWPYEIASGDKLLIPCGRLTHSEWRERMGDAMFNQGGWKKLLGHLFVRSAHRPAPVVAPASAADTTTVVVDKGDTVKDVAQFAHTTQKEIIKLNHLKSPYRLRAGQELLIPAKIKTRTKSSAKSKKSKSASRRKKK